MYTLHSTEHARDAVIRPEEIHVKKSREYFKRLATIDERAKKKKKRKKRKLDPEYKRGKKLRRCCGALRILDLVTSLHSLE